MTIRMCNNVQWAHENERSETMSELMNISHCPLFLYSLSFFSISLSLSLSLSIHRLIYYLSICLFVYLPHCLLHYKRYFPDHSEVNLHHENYQHVVMIRSVLGHLAFKTYHLLVYYIRLQLMYIFTVYAYQSDMYTLHSYSNFQSLISF